MARIGLAGALAPALPRGFVTRPRVDELLRDAAELPIVLVCAPAGSGKTVVVSSWAEQQADTHRVLWIDCAAVGGSPLSFWRALMTGLDAGTDEATDDTAPQSADASREEADAALRRLAADSRPTVVVWDDFHRVTSSEVQSGVQHLLERLPEHVTVVLITRTLPQLALYRARVEGRLGELRGEDLDFTVPETAQLLEANGVTLSTDAVHTLHDTTQGWAAGLRLAVISMSRAPDPYAVIEQLSHTTEAVSGYLTEQVIGSLDRGDRELILDTCVVDVLDGRLAEALSGRPDGTGRLRGVADRVGFLTPLHDADESFGYHPMFAEIVRGQLRHADPSRYRAQHTRAAEWFVAQGRPDAALRHAVEARDWDLVGRVLGQDLLILAGHGSVDRIAEALAQAPADIVVGDPRLQLATVVVDVMGDRLSNAPARLEEIVRRLPQRDDLAGRRFGATVVAVRALVARYLGDAPAMLDALGEHAPDLPEPGSAAYISQDGATLLSWHGHRCGALLWADRLPESLQEAERTLQLAGSGPASWHVIAAHSVRALIHATDGDLGLADQAGTAAVSRQERRSWTAVPYLCLAELAEAWAAIERCDLDRAGRALTRAQERFSQLHSGFPGVLIPLLQCRLALAGQEGPHLASSYLEVADERLTTIDSALLVRLRGFVAVELHLAAGDLEWAERTAAGLALDVQHWVRLRAALSAPTEQAVLALVAAPAGDPDNAIRVRQLVASAALLHEVGESAEADHALDESLRIADVDGVRLPFVRLSTQLHPLLSRAPVSAARHGGLVATLLGLTRQGQPGRHADYTQPLTARELEILQLLVVGVEVDEIAAHLFVSRNTVRSHVKSIYRKLSANSRREAVLRAASLGVI